MSGTRWEAMMVRQYQDREGKTRGHWTKIGAAFTNKDGSIGVQLDAIPVDGKIVLQVALSKAEREAKFGGHGRAMREQQQGGSQASRYRQQRVPSAPQSAGTLFRGGAPEYEPEEEATGPQDDGSEPDFEEGGPRFR